MIGAYDFCGHYEWTFAWLERAGGPGLVRDYWEEAISRDAGLHARELIVPKGIEGMAAYWRHTLEEEAAGYELTSDKSCFRIDMHACPSKGFLIRNGLRQYSDYCDHCIGWIGPMMRDAGFVVDHEHNHCGQCWWEFRRAEDETSPSEIGGFSGRHDVRSREDWRQADMDCFHRATIAEKKQRAPLSASTSDTDPGKPETPSHG